LSIEKQFIGLVVAIVLMVMLLPLLFMQTRDSANKKRAALLTELSGRKWTAEEVQLLNPVVTVIVGSHIEINPERTP